MVNRPSVSQVKPRTSQARVTPLITAQDAMAAASRRRPTVAWTPYEQDRANGRIAAGRVRDATATHRDDAAQKRDEQAADRDSSAETALELEELRARGLEDRRSAARDRALAAADRGFAAGERAEAKRELEHSAIDELTGARRRGVGLDDLRREIDRARRTGTTLVAAYLDVDDLKRVNDEHGHRAGDRLLRDVAGCVARHMRSYDLLVRLGGDEFLCVLAGVTVDDARRRFTRISSELAARHVARSISVGLSELRNGDEPHELIDRADQDLLARRAHEPRNGKSVSRDAVRAPARRSWRRGNPWRARRRAARPGGAAAR
jgi:diguanylate cyclase (GGDEF)-like protein